MGEAHSARGDVSLREQWRTTVRAMVIGARRADAEPATLLADAAVLGTAAFGARLPDAVPESGGMPTSPVPVAPPDTRPAAPLPALDVLDHALALGDEGLLVEWCAAAGRGGAVAAHRQLPVLLALGTARPGLRSALLGVLGARGHWLADCRPAWSWATGQELTAGPNGADLDAVLDLPAHRRTAVLRAARRADPVAAGAAIGELYAAARRAPDRQALITALSAGLGAHDEALLEAALDDRSVAVHDLALTLLRRLPGSALAARATRRLATGLILVERGDHLALRQDGPYARPEPDPVEARDLLRDGQVETGVAGRLRGAAASVSPEILAGLLGMSAPRAADRLRRGPWAAALLRGVAAALPSASDPRPWAVAACDALSGMEKLDMLAALPPRLAGELLVAVSRDWTWDLLDHACAQLPAPWPPDTTGSLLDRYAALPDPSWRSGRPPASLLTRGDVPVLLAGWDRITERWPHHSAERDVLRLRAQLHEAFTTGQRESP
ncbi:hypothetical protein F0L68_25600 [Solihabitans fulvus]|uniref:Uncharacterized protein n=1 Tax=Solihabitans fulvus TaxID=1892852 RepID=A0A5B2X1N4_9PSEU|nr:DUF5691 domain-containing protein [Solihabitans fulvus]KAA2257117.1 hypothetical protein F0L68_25600 [Solihabitans fulvus]